MREVIKPYIEVSVIINLLCLPVSPASGAGDTELQELVCLTDLKGVVNTEQTRADHLVTMSLAAVTVTQHNN